jgi:sialic acid synthase SpsE/quercetin dioxygenase-like cupin family protein
MDNYFKNLFVFEIANNHQGDVEHGLNIIREMGKIANKYRINAGVKFQYRHLDTFIHPDFREDKNAKHINRFLSTKLTSDEYKTMVSVVKKEGMLTVCTPFDERSVDQIIEHEIDVIKVASCSADDWPLLNKIAQTDKPIIVSTGGLDLYKIDNLVSFLSNRNKIFAILHCVGIYPSQNEVLNLQFIKKMKNRYPEVTIGYSGHESPDNLDVIKIASAFGAEIFERHVGLPTDKIALNKYSMSPEQTANWVNAQKTAGIIIGSENKTITKLEEESLLSLKRGVFVNKKIKKGYAISRGNVFFAMPSSMGQLNSGEFGRVRTRFVASKDYEKNEAVFESCKTDTYSELRKIIHRAKGMLSESKIILSKNAEIELSHHYGIENFHKFGCLIVSMVNREYCKKIIVVFEGQHHPEQKHIKKEETFHILSGELIVTLDGIVYNLEKGDVITIERGVIHSFYSNKGAIIEEISTTHYRNDSFYTDPLISEQDPMARKTVLRNF